jgi:AraC family transcriptional regulator
VRAVYRYMPPISVLYARSVGPYETSSHEAWRKMASWLEQHQLCRRVKRVYGVLRDNPKLTAPELLRYDACVPVTFGFDVDPDGAIGRQMLAGGAFAVHTHVGSYAEAGEIFSSLHREIVPKRRLSLDHDRPFMAIYLNDPRITREVHRRTDLCIPVLPICMPLPSNDTGDDPVFDVGSRVAG